MKSRAGLDAADSAPDLDTFDDVARAQSHRLTRLGSDTDRGRHDGKEITLMTAQVIPFAQRDIETDLLE